MRVFFYPWIRDPGWVNSLDLDPGSGSGMNNPDKILKQFFEVKMHKFFGVDSGSGMEKNSDPISRINIPDLQHCLGGLKENISLQVSISYNNYPK